MNLLFKILFFVLCAIVFTDSLSAQNSKKKIVETIVVPTVQKVVFDDNNSVEPVMTYSTAQVKPTNVIATVSQVSETISNSKKSESTVPYSKKKVIETRLTVKKKETIINSSVTKVE